MVTPVLFFLRHELIFLGRIYAPCGANPPVHIPTFNLKFENILSVRPYFETFR